MSKGLQKETGHAFLVTVLRVFLGAVFLEAGTGHFVGGEGVFKGIVGATSWFGLNSSFMFPLVYISMWLTGISLIFGLLARLGSLSVLIFSIFFIVVVNSWFGNFTQLAIAFGFLFIGPGRYYGLDSWLLEKVPGLKILA